MAHRLQDREPEAFIQARKQQQPRLPVKRIASLATDPPQQAAARRGSQPGLQMGICSRSSAHEQEVAVQAFDSFESRDLVLAPLDAADMEGKRAVDAKAGQHAIIR